MRRGYTLIELSLVLTLATMTCLTLLPTARRLRDRMAVVAAREALAGLIARARVDALARGGSTVHVRGVSGRAWYEASDSVLATLELQRDFAVTVALGGTRDSADLRFDALGIGRIASQTLRFRRGSEEAVLVVSGYGRVRRR